MKIFLEIDDNICFYECDRNNPEAKTNDEKRKKRINKIRKKEINF